MLTKKDSCDEFMIGYRNSALAAKAWYREKPRFHNHPNRDNFRDGFIAGYIDVAEGGDGCLPAVGPPEYWGWRFQSAEGQRAYAAWFAGFPHGARAAEEDGVGNWGDIRPIGMGTSSGHPGKGTAATTAAPAFNGVNEGEEIVPGSIIEVDRSPSGPEELLPPGATGDLGSTFRPGNQLVPEARLEGDSPFGGMIGGNEGQSPGGQGNEGQSPQPLTERSSGLSFRFD